MAAPEIRNYLIVGAGGLGCELLKVLVHNPRLKITVVDEDKIDISNLSRQFLYVRNDIGYAKAEIAARRYGKGIGEDRYGRASVKLYTKNVLLFKRIAFYRQFHAIFCCVDNQATRSFLNERCIFAGVPMIDGGTAQWLGQSFKTGDVCFDCLPRKKDENEGPIPVCSIRGRPQTFQQCLSWSMLLVIRSTREEFFSEMTQFVPDDNGSYAPLNILKCPSSDVVLGETWEIRENGGSAGHPSTSIAEDLAALREKLREDKPLYPLRRTLGNSPAGAGTQQNADDAANEKDERSSSDEDAVAKAEILSSCPVSPTPAEIGCEKRQDRNGDHGEGTHQAETVAETVQEWRDSVYYIIKTMSENCKRAREESRGIKKKGCVYPPRTEAQKQRLKARELDESRATLPVDSKICDLADLLDSDEPDRIAEDSIGITGAICGQDSSHPEDTGNWRLPSEFMLGPQASDRPDCFSYQRHRIRTPNWRLLRGPKSNHFRITPTPKTRKAILALYDSKDRVAKIALIYEMAVRRARRFGVGALSFLESQNYILNIVPTICTSNAVVASLMTLNANTMDSYFLVQNPFRLLKLEPALPNPNCKTCGIASYYCRVNPHANAGDLCRYFNFECFSAMCCIFDRQSYTPLSALDGEFGIAVAPGALYYRIYFEVADELPGQLFEIQRVR